MPVPIPISSEHHVCTIPKKSAEHASNLNLITGAQLAIFSIFVVILYVLRAGLWYFASLIHWGVWHMAHVRPNVRAQCAAKNSGVWVFLIKGPLPSSRSHFACGVCAFPAFPPLHPLPLVTACGLLEARSAIPTCPPPPQVQAGQRM